MTDSAIFIGTLIIGFTEIVRIACGTDSAGRRRISGILTVMVAVLVGVLTSVFGTPLGVTHISVAQGVLIALSSVGVHTLASAVATNVKK